MADEAQTDVFADLEDASPATQHKYWMRELEESKTYYAKYLKSAKKVEDRYRDADRPEDVALTVHQDVDVRGINILYSNTETMKGAVYANPPQVVVERRFPGEDVVTRVAAEVLERALTFVAHDDDLHDKMKQGRLDYLLPGRFTLRAYYEVDTDEDLDAFDAEDGTDIADGAPNPATANPMMPGADPMTPMTPMDPMIAGMGHNGGPAIPAILDQRVCLKRVALDDFLDSADPTWDSTRWVAFRSQMSRKSIKRRFGEEKAKKITLNTSMFTKDDKDNLTEKTLAEVENAWKRAEVWEIWDKARRMVWWISDGYRDGPLDVRPDPLGLNKFWPCPRPAIAVQSNVTKIPVPLFALYMDQAAEIDRLTMRIYSIVDGIRANGLFAGEHKNEFKKLFTADNELIGVEDFAAMMDKGGIGKLIEWMPIKEMAEVVTSLYSAREQAKTELFEISGMADIIRGSSDPRETLGAQKIKGQFATIRLEDHQQNLANFAQDTLEIAGEIIAEHFEPETLERITGIKMPMDSEANKIEAMEMVAQFMQSPQAQDPQAAEALNAQIQEIMERPTWADVMGVLRADDVRRYMIRVETDSTIKMDQERDRAERVEAVRAVGETIATFGPAVIAGQMPFELFKKMVMFLIRGFPGAREVEAMLDEWKQPPPPAPEQQAEPNPAPEVAKIKEEGANTRKAAELDAAAVEAEKARQFMASEAEKDRTLKVLEQTISAADKVAKSREARIQAQQKMRQGNGA